MKAAFLSELAIVRTFVLSFIGILAFVFIFICWTMESAAGATAVVCAMTPMLIMFSLMGYDDQNGWLRYRAALPFARRDIITSRYATILACAAAVIVCASVLGIVLNGALPRFLEGFEAAGPIEIISSSVAATMAVLIIAAIVEPFLVKFGNTKGIRYLMCVFILAGCIDVVILTNFLAPDVMQSILAWINAHSLALFAALTVAALAIYAASCFISIRIFQAKDL